jgi:hypothetical protein
MGMSISLGRRFLRMPEGSGPRAAPCGGDDRSLSGAALNRGHARNDTWQLLSGAKLYRV